MQIFRHLAKKTFLEHDRRFASASGDRPLKKVLLLKKRTRYELEKLSQAKPISDEDFAETLRQRGAHADGLIESYKVHRKLSIDLKLAFQNEGFEVNVIDRTQYNSDAIDWADVVVTAGGDGTFLMGAADITTRDKPLIGFNTNPDRSAGYLCLPDSFSYETAAKRLRKGDFQWKYRTRIEVKLTGQSNDKPELIGLQPDKSKQEDTLIDQCTPTVSRVLPSKALNEIFFAHRRPSQVTNLIVDVPGVPPTHIKCSGVCVSTGTGSTSWHMSMNRVSLSKVHRLFKIANIDSTPDKLVQIISEYNGSLQFPFDDPRMFYTCRDLIYSPITPSPSGFPSAAFTPSISLVSKCISASVVIDGTRAWNFNDGTIAELTTRPEISLQTVHFPHSSK